MSKAVLISINPKWVTMILNGKKTIEVRKTMPDWHNLPCKVYIYCSKAKSTNRKLVRCPDIDKNKTFYTLGHYGERRDGKVVAEFTLRTVVDFKLVDRFVQWIDSVWEVSSYHRGVKNG